MLSRRFFLKVASGLLAFVPAAKVLANPNAPNRVFLPLVSSSNADEANAALDAPPPPSPDWDPDTIVPNSVIGTIQKISEDQIVVDSAAQGLVKLNLSATTKLWKGDWDKKYLAKVGDEIYAWGQPQADGKIVALEKAWVNIVSLSGETQNLVHSTSGFNLLNPNGDKTYITFDQNTEFVLPSDTYLTVAQGNSLQIKGEYISQVIGVRLEDSAILATRVFLDKPIQDTDKQPNGEALVTSASPNQIQAAFYAGTLAWFSICNGSNGSCASYGYPCNNNSNHVAWPKLSTTSCNYTCVSSLPWLACGAQVWVRNDCFNTSLYGQVRTCSSMSQGGCPTNYYCNGTPGSGLKPMLELTSTMFVALGDNLNDGRERGTIYA